MSNKRNKQKKAKKTFLFFFFKKSFLCICLHRSIARDEQKVDGFDVSDSV